MNMKHCDFCHEPNPTWGYPCESFSVPLLDSVGHWATCDACHLAIEAGDRALLFARGVGHAVTVLAPIPAVELLIYEAQIKQLQDGFFAHRTGPCWLIKETVQ